MYKLLIVTDGIFYRDSNDCYYVMNDTFPLFIRNLSEFFDVMAFASPIITLEESKDIKLSRVCCESEDRIKFIETQFYTSFIGYLVSLPRQMKNIFTFIKTVKQFDLILLRTSGLNVFFAAAVCLMYSVPYVVYISGDHQVGSASFRKEVKIYEKIVRLLGKVHTRMIKMVIRKCAFVAVCGSGLIQRYFVRGKTYHIVFPNFVEVVNCDKSSRIRNNTKNIVSVGRLSAEKNLGVIILAISILVGRGMDVSLTIVGDGPEFKNIEELICMHKLESNCKMCGYIPQGKMLEEIWMQSDLFVISSTSEGTPKALLEAFSYGIPSVCSKVGGIPDIISDGENGLFCENNPIDFANKIELILSNFELYSKISNNAKTWIVNHTNSAELIRINNEMVKYIGNI